MRIAILCNDRIALPALDHLMAAGFVVSVGMPNKLHEISWLVRNKCTAAGVPVQWFGRESLAIQLELWLAKYQPEIVLVKTFPFLVPGEVLDIPRHGFINFHYAPLPEWRGSHPLFWMIRNGAATGGVTVHQMNESFDAGPILLEQQVSLSPDVSYGYFYTQLAYTGLYCTGALLSGLKAGNLHPALQDHSRAKWYSRPQPADLFIDWQTMSATEIRALVNACNPWNKGAPTIWNGWTFGISDSSIVRQRKEEKPPGTIIFTDAENGFQVACKDGEAIRADVIYCEEGFYPGYRLSAFGLQKGDRLG